MTGIYTKGKESKESPSKLWDLTNVKPFLDSFDQREGHYVFGDGLNTENMYKNDPVPKEIKMSSVPTGTLTINTGGKEKTTNIDPEAAIYTGNSSGTLDYSQIGDPSTTWYSLEVGDKIQHNPEDLVEFETVCVPTNLESNNSLSNTIDEVFGDGDGPQNVVYRAHWHCNKCHAHGTIWAIKKRGIYKCTQCGNFTESIFIEDKSNGDEEIGHYDNIW